VRQRLGPPIAAIMAIMDLPTTNRADHEVNVMISTIWWP
jgi:hypothetical protein